MTIKELKELIADVDDDVIVMVKDNNGEYDIADDGYEDMRDIWKIGQGKNHSRKVFCIY